MREIKFEQLKKCLIIGDFSSLGKNLKSGFEKIGIKTQIISTGDGWKNIKYEDENDIKLKLKNIYFFNKEIPRTIRLRYYFYELRELMKVLENEKYNYILIMNQSFVSYGLPGFINSGLYLPLNFLQKILKREGKIYMLACGDDSYYLEAEKIYKYFPYNEIDIRKSNYMKNYSRYKYKKILSKIAGIIPTTFDYAEAYRQFYCHREKLKITIPFPLDLKSIKYDENIIREKIIIFHGLNREEFKGTKYIREAMENIKKKYPNKVEIIIDGKMPLEKYKEVIAKTNILIDQCRSYGYGMNALYGMAMGKLVFSGNEPENEKEFGEKNIPVVNITPNVEDIEKKLEYYILNPELIINEGKRAREFVEKFHDSEIIAKQYLKLFEKDSRTDEK